mgnify:CR=1 FL=1
MKHLRELIDQKVVLDTDTPFLYLGDLVSADEDFVTLSGADACYCEEIGSTREQYLVEAAKYGIKKNRKQVHVRNTAIVSVSRLEDIIKF